MTSRVRLRHGWMRMLRIDQSHRCSVTDHNVMPPPPTKLVFMDVMVMLCCLRLPICHSRYTVSLKRVWYQGRPFNTHQACTLFALGKAASLLCYSSRLTRIIKPFFSRVVVRCIQIQSWELPVFSFNSHDGRRFHFWRLQWRPNPGPGWSGQEAHVECLVRILSSHFFFCYRKPQAWPSSQNLMRSILVSLT